MKFLAGRMKRATDVEDVALVQKRCSQRRTAYDLKRVDSQTSLTSATLSSSHDDSQHVARVRPNNLIIEKRRKPKHEPSFALDAFFRSEHNQKPRKKVNSSSRSCASIPVRSSGAPQTRSVQRRSSLLTADDYISEYEKIVTDGTSSPESLFGQTGWE